MAKKKANKQIPSKEDVKLWAFLATFLSIVGFLIVFFAKKKDDYIKFYAKQGLVVFIAILLLGIISSIFAILPIIGQIVYLACNVASFLLWLTSWIYALSGEEKEVPIVGEYADKINL